MKVLLVDDEFPTLEFLENALDWEGMGIKAVRTAMDGEEALREIESDCPDILITDIRMSKMDGLELVKIIRETNSSMKIIILSAFGEFEYAQSAIKYDVAGYILKPIDEEELSELILQVIEQIKSIQAKNDKYSEAMSLFNNLAGNSVQTYEEGNSLVKEAKNYISSKYNTNITLDEICNHIAISKNYFCYLFKRETSQSIWDYLTDIRIEKAKELLKKIDTKAYEVSFNVGYENPNYFTKIFKIRTGMTPQEYRSRNMQSKTR